LGSARSRDEIWAIGSGCETLYGARWDNHDEFCSDCDLCRDQVPIMLFRGEGKDTEQASFHTACFEKILFVRSKITQTTESGNAAPR